MNDSNDLTSIKINYRQIKTGPEELEIRLNKAFDILFEKAINIREIPRHCESKQWKHD